MAYNLLLCHREQDYMMPPSLREWLAEGDLAWFTARVHHEWFVLDAVGQVHLEQVHCEQVELSGFYTGYRIDGWGAARGFTPRGWAKARWN